MSKTASAYLIRCITNLHAGKGDTTYGVIDKEVQRDPITRLPVIHSSSMKGALREHFEAHSPNVEAIFGTKGGNAKPGSFHFHEARLLALPVRSDKAPYILVTTPCILKEFVELLELYKVNNHDKMKTELNGMLGFKEEEIKEKADLYGCKSLESAILEDFEYSQMHVDEMPENLKPIFGNNLAVVSTKKMKAYCERLPVIARNKLNNGQSENLFYEEVVPRETRFYTLVLKVQNNTVNFDTTLTNTNTNNKILQIGANATVGYGKTLISKITMK